MRVKRHTPNVLQHPFYPLQKVLNPYGNEYSICVIVY